MTELSSSPISVLLACRDSNDTALITEAMKKFGVSVTHSAETEALELVQREKFEAAVVDFNIPVAPTILDELRRSPSNKTAVTFAIVNGKSGAVSTLKVRASFLLQRPLSAPLLYRTLQAAYGMMLQERRRYFRCPIVVPVTLQLGAETAKISAHTVNVSQNGLAVNTPVALNAGDAIALQFKLPQLASVISGNAAVRWYREGRAGLLFLDVNTSLRAELCEWLSKRLEAFLRPPQQ